MSTDTRKRNAKIKRFINQIPVLRTVASSIFGLFKAFLILKYYIISHYFKAMTEPEKREHIFKISRIFGTRIFVETGTYLGLTTEFLAPHFEKCFTIEIDEDLYKRAKDRLKDFKNVQVIHGSSDTSLPKVLNQINGPALFWLDAHYCGGTTGRRELDTPIKQELVEIFEHPIKNHVILIDDARLFIGIYEYPTVASIAKFVREKGNGYQLRMHNDIMIIYRDTI